MRTTLALDDDLIAKAQAYTGLSEKSALVREALKALIQREARALLWQRPRRRFISLRVRRSLIAEVVTSTPHS
jgi:Arc/MetJ family transcription regulator